TLASRAVAFQQRCKLVAHLGVGGVDARYPGGALRGRDVEGLVKEFADLAPALRRHSFPDWVSSLYSHASASLCSLPIVATERSTVGAVSSTLRPPKNRSSMIWHLRGSTAASAFNASSRAITSAPRSGAKLSASSKGAFGAPPPRFALLC